MDTPVNGDRESDTGFVGNASASTPAILEGLHGAVGGLQAWGGVSLWRRLGLGVGLWVYLARLGVVGMGLDIGESGF